MPVRLFSHISAMRGVVMALWSSVSTGEGLFPAVNMAHSSNASYTLPAAEAYPINVLTRQAVPMAPDASHDAGLAAQRAQQAAGGFRPTLAHCCPSPVASGASSPYSLSRVVSLLEDEDFGGLAAAEARWHEAEAQRQRERVGPSDGRESPLLSAPMLSAPLRARLADT